MMHPNKEEVRKNARMTAWMNKELLAKHKQEKKVYRGWKQGQVAWEQKQKLSEQPEIRLGKAKP